MKLTKSKLKQIIKEELEANPLPWWMKMTDELLAEAEKMYGQATLPPEGKEYMINNFEKSVLQWKKK